MIEAQVASFAQEEQHTAGVFWLDAFSPLAPVWPEFAYKDGCECHWHWLGAQAKSTPGHKTKLVYHAPGHMMTLTPRATAFWEAQRSLIRPSSQSVEFYTGPVNLELTRQLMASVIDLSSHTERRRRHLRGLT